MPKYNITLTRVNTVVYDTTEIEADDQAEAIRMVTEMATEDEEVAETSKDETITAEAKLVTEG